MRLRILAPFRSHLRLALACAVKTGQLSMLSDDYQEFWRTAQDDILSGDDAPWRQKLEKVAFLHGGTPFADNDGPRYTRIDADAVCYTAEIAQFWPSVLPALTGDELDGVIAELGKKRSAGKTAFDALAPRARLALNGVRIRVFDDTISLLEADLNITDLLPAADDNLDDFEKNLREFAVFLGEALVLFYYRDAVFPCLRWLSAERDPGHQFVEDQHTTDETLESMSSNGGLFRYPLPDADREAAVDTEVLWVTRSLMCDPSDRKQVDLGPIVTAWLKDIGTSDEAKTAMQEALDASGYCARWLNYVFREDFVRSSEFEHVWEAMVQCQYHYSALDGLNDRLNAVLAQSNRTKKKHDVSSLHNVLDETVRRTDILLLNYNEIQNYVNRDKLDAIRKIMKFWEFDRIEAATRERMKVCRERIDDLHRKSTEKSSYYIELVLFCIGLLAVLDLGVTLALFGRAPGDSAFAQDELYSGHVLSILAKAPATSIIAGAGIIIGALVLLFFLQRSNKRLR